ncbi:MAG: NAD(P)H-binding protein [Actinophytocola sp.]|uniref:SDR family oxidoreductase n=1 Tax=Actinophytocola sp. TaxID=1872138 RepID=UPI001320FE64|nr:SDR family oxidoreductase [Actinophytocola sp.]MPZ79269.1 NAD(P)H-binding protein [Actinophytocola sp.]
MTILITGANGNVSSTLLRSLDSQDVRALVRDPAKAPEGVPVAIGDLDDPASLTSAFEGVDVLWLLTAMGPQAPHQSMNAVWAAKQARVEHVVRMSAIGAAYDAPTRNGRLHALSDAELAGSGIDWTIIKPASFMQNMIGAVNDGVLYGANGDARVGLIDVGDIAEFAAHVLADPAPHAGRTYTLTGPASISLHDAAAEVGATYHPLTPEQAYEAMVQGGLDEWLASMGAEYAAAFSAGWGDLTTTDFADVIGRQPRTFAEFACDSM